MRKKIKVGDLYLQKWYDGEIAITRCTTINDDSIGGIPIKILSEGRVPVLEIDKYSFCTFCNKVAIYKLNNENEALAYLI